MCAFCRLNNNIEIICKLFPPSHSTAIANAREKRITASFIYHSRGESKKKENSIKLLATKAEKKREKVFPYQAPESNLEVLRQLVEDVKLLKL